MNRYFKNPEYLHLLVAEDDQDFILLLNGIIEEIKEPNIKITFASSLSQCLQCLEHNSFDAILLDLNIGDSFGINTFNEIKKAAPNLAIIIHTSQNREEFIETVLSKGAQDYLLKGEYNSRLLIRSIRYSILSKARENELQESKERYKLLYENNPAPMSIIDEGAMQVISVNDAADKLYGANAKYLLQKSLDGFIQEMLRTNDGSFTKANWETMDWETCPQHREDGSIFYVNIKSNKISLEGKTCWLNVFHDVTERHIAGEQIRKVTANLRALLDNTQQGYFLLDCEGRMVLANNAANKIWANWNVKPITEGMKLADSLPEPTRGWFLERLNRTLQGEVISVEVPYDILSGKRIWIETNSSPVRAEDGEIIGVCNSINDITLKVEKQQKLEETEANLRAVLDNSMIGYFLFDKEGTVVIANSAINKIGKALSMDHFVTGNKLADLPDELTRNTFIEHFNKALDGELINIEQEFYNTNGQKTWLEISFYPVHDKNNEIIGVCNCLRDTTQKVAALEKLRESEMNLRATIDNISLGYCLLDTKGNIIIQNKNRTELLLKLGSPLSRVGENIIEHVSPTFRDKFITYFNTAINGKSVIDTNEYKSTSGANIWIEANFNPVTDENGKTIAIAYGIRDITEKVKSQEKLLMAEANLRTTLDNTTEGYCLLDRNGKIIIKNRVRDEILATMGKAPMNIGEKISDHILGPNREFFLQNFNQALNGEHISAKNEYINPDGNIMWLEVSFKPVKNNNGAIVAIAHGLKDITEKVIAEQKLRSREAELRAIFENTVQGYCMLDPIAKVLLFNKKAGSIWNKVNGSVLKEGDSLFEMLPEPRLEKFRSIFDKVIKGEILEFEMEHNLANGEKIWIEYTFNPVTTPDGSIIGVCEGIRDITARITDQQTLMQYANELTKANYGQANAIANLKKTNTELDRFIYCASHEMRGPLTSIMGLINMGDSEVPEEYKIYFEMMKNRVDALDELILDIISHSRNARLPKQIQEIDLTKTIKNIINGYQYTIPSNLNFELDINNNKPFWSDQGKIKMIINALLSNAIKYSDCTKEKPKVIITVNIYNEYANIKIFDNGIGINNAYKDKIFNMFYRATEVSTGSGLGLYILKEAVEILEGSIKVESELGKGSCFTVLIPNMKPKSDYQVA